jgi:pimeloyl-ACP methyl ester carboxylesterase
MKQIVVFCLVIFGVIGCGNVNTDNNCCDGSKNSLIDDANQRVVDKNDTEVNILPPVVKDILPPAFVDLNKTHNPNDTVTVYVHGFSGHGAGKIDTIYGADEHESFMDDIPTFLGLPTINNPKDINKTNVFAATGYYGDTPPSYYTEQDKEDIAKVTEEFGGGIPRYALIVAKYSKHLMERTGAKQVNFISGSMGALVTRYLIEKNLEGLAADKKIARWLTLEGVVNGNYAASNDIVKLVKLIEKPTIDVKHMSYDWIENNLASGRRTASSPYYKDILIGHETSTKDNLMEHALTSLLVLNGQYQPNDAYQVVKDTYFQDVAKESRFMGQMPTHSYFHENHLSVKDSKGVWAEIGTFLTSNKRVKITLTKAKVFDKHDSDTTVRILGHNVVKHTNKGEIVFSSKIYSPEVKRRWKISSEISNLTIKGAVPSIVKYKHNGDENSVNQILFDDLVLENEKELRLDLDVKEIDQDFRYGVNERPLKLERKDYDNVGSSSVTIPLKDGTYAFENENYTYEVNVELFDYDFPILGDASVSNVDLIATIEHFYKSILHREPTEKEKESWLNYLHTDPYNNVKILGRTLLNLEEIEALDDDSYLERANIAFANNQVTLLSTTKDDGLAEIIDSDESRLFLSTLFGEQGGDSSRVGERGELIYYEKVSAKNSEYMHQLYQPLLEKYPALANSKQYGVEAYKIVYTTVDEEGKKVNASGLMTIPLNVGKPIGLVSDQHGTLFGDKYAPSEHAPLQTTGALISTLKGYAVTMPDYIGYGVTSTQYHPYQVKDSLAPVVVDLIVASKKFMEERQVESNNKLFLTGYSEGGYATMSALELIEKEYKDTLSVTAAAPMAGSYDMKATADYVLLGENEYSTPHLPLFLLYSYNRYYGWDILASMLQAPIYDEITKFISEKEKGNVLSTNFPIERSRLYEESFLTSYREGQEVQLNKALKENSIMNWKPTMPMRLYHCKGDVVVPSFNSQNAYDAFVKNGSTSVKLILKEGGSHSSCSIPAYLEAFAWFDSLNGRE